MPMVWKLFLCFGSAESNIGFLKGVTFIAAGVLGDIKEERSNISQDSLFICKGGGGPTSSLVMVSSEFSQKKNSANSKN